MGMPTSINSFHQDKWKVNFSNIPSMDGLVDMPLYDLFVKSLTIPSLELTEVFSNFKQYAIGHPISKGNVELGQLQITFKADESLTNYYNLFKWILNLRFGVNINEEVIRQNTIKNINLMMLDNMKQTKAVLEFGSCFLVSLGDLTLEYGTSDELNFNTTFSYTTINLNTDVSSI